MDANDPRFVSFVGSDAGAWRVMRFEVVSGDALAPVDRIAVEERLVRDETNWILRGLRSNVRYSTVDEKTELERKQEGLGRQEATRAALIPISKSSEWWAFAQDERRRIFEEDSRHTQIGLDYLPQVARRLYHGRDLAEPFDFLTWFEYAPEHAELFERLVERLRATSEWAYVIREVDIRLQRDET